MLRNEVCSVDDLRVQRIPQLFGQGAPDHLKRPALVMAFQVLDVLQHEGCRTVVHQDAQHVEKQCALGFIEEAMRASERILLGNASDRERLARETGHKNIVIGDIFWSYLADISRDRAIVREVGVIGLLGETIPFRCKDTTPPCPFHGSSQAADPCKEINERE